MRKTLKLLILLISICFSYGKLYAQFENQYSIFLSDYPCIENKDRKELFYPIKEEDDEIRMILKFDRELIKRMYIEDQLVTNLTPYLFTSLQEKKEYDIRIVLNDDSEIDYKLIFTTLPIVCIDTNGNTLKREYKVECDITIFDPYGRTNGKEYLFSHVAGIRVRGQSSSIYDKKSYGVELWDSQGEEVDAAILGLRSDGDWILDAMYVDCARMRNRVCFDIWNSFSNVPHIEQEPDACNGTYGYFVEVFLNSSYNGLYCLSDRIDRKQLKLIKDIELGGVLFKARAWGEAITLFDYNAWPNESLLDWKGWGSEYPGVAGYARFDLLAELIDFINNEEEEIIAAELGEWVHLENFLDYILFTHIFSAWDNWGKNTFLSIYNLKKDKRFFISPWDLDATFGRNTDGTLLNLFAFDLLEYGFTENNKLFDHIWKLNPDNSFIRFMERWDEIKKDQLSCDKINEIIDNYKESHLKSGAWERERNLWPEFCGDLEEETDFMKEWYAKSYIITDEALQKHANKFPTLIESPHMEEQLKLYVKDNNIYVELEVEDEFLVEVLDLSGRTIFATNYFSPSTVIPVSASGLYIVKITGNFYSFSRKTLVK